MKDKRQRIAIAWPYAAVYSDPAFAASILQAAANSVGMPYGYPGGGQLPTNRLAYGFPPSVRYNPYPIPIPPQGYNNQHDTQISGYSQTNGITHQSPLGLSHNHGQVAARSPKDLSLSVSPPSQGIRSPTSSSSSLSPDDSDRIKCDFGSNSGAQDDKTILPLMVGGGGAGDKPNLFRPYKSEA